VVALPSVPEVVPLTPGRTLDAAERERLIVEHLPLVRGLARRYADRGEPLDDLVQVGTIGLIKAIDRFEPERGFKLASFATPTILGEIRRHFRDRSWTVRVPRGIQEARAQISHAVGVFSAEKGRSPSVREIAEQTGLPLDDFLDALAAGSAQRPAPLATGSGDAEEDVGISVGVDEEGYAAAEARATIDAGLAELPARERIILHLRFEEGLTQSQIAERVGISQMHVSRLIRRALETLRENAGDPDPATRDEPGRR
jgi:RNA polymerase sigma-B factor